MMKTARISHRSLESLHSLRVNDTVFRGKLVRASSTSAKLGSLVFTRMGKVGLTRCYIG